jgi:alpha-L-fucosidase 2
MNIKIAAFSFRRSYWNNYSMKKNIFKFHFFVLAIAGIYETHAQNILWYKKPADSWESQALPIGNGRLGGMVFGQVNDERIQLNEETIWTGNPSKTDREGAGMYLKEVRNLLFKGEYAQAQSIVEKDMQGTGGWNTYQTLGDLYIKSIHDGEITDYYRDLDLDSAIAHVSYKAGGITYKREYFSSAVDQSLAIRISCDKPGGVNLSVRLKRPKAGNTTAKNNTLTMSGEITAPRTDFPGVNYEAQLRSFCEGGTISASGDSLIVKGASSVVFYLAAASNYGKKNPHQECEKTLNAIAGKDFKSVKKDHIADHQRLFNRVKLDLGTNEKSKLPTDERLNNFKNGDTDDAQLISLYYQYGRYMLIGSSRPGDLPANLQGIWADGLTPPWSADYHININIQMNYWLAEVTNLSECHLPFIVFVDSLRKKGRMTAKTLYNSRGFVAHYTSDIWNWTTYEGKAEWGMWPMGAAWSCQHVWEHYAFTGDKEYLKEAYPILKEASEFFEDYLVKDPHTGYLVSGPSSSPENKFKTKEGIISNITMGPAMDMEIIWDLLTNTIEASKILNTDEAFRKKLEIIKSKLSPLKIRKDGRLMEWTEEFDEPEPGHRHISHLFALYPGKQISVSKTPEFAEACRKTINYRLAHGGGHTGWSRAWIVNYYARLHDGENAYTHFKALLSKSTNSNLFDMHPPFQIDGNFGGTAGITEMLLQSHVGEIHLLPALPKALAKGSIQGLVARGGFEVNMEWENGALKKVSILSRLGNDCKIRSGSKLIDLKTEKGKMYSFDGGLKQL